MKRIQKYFIVALLTVIAGAWTWQNVNRPTVYLIGDSTVKNGKGAGDGGLWGWGKYLPDFFDTTRIVIENDAIGGRSSRTFITEGRWDKVLEKLKPGDFVIMQFGHNDGGALADSSRARGTIKGIGEESKEVYNPIMKKQEVVHTYGWYMRKYIQDTKAKGAIAIVCSPIPRNDWKDGKVKRDTSTYAKWAEQVAQSEGAYFIPLNKIVADHYDVLGETTIRATYFTPQDHTHTMADGAKLNAASVVEGIKMLQGCPLNTFLKDYAAPKSDKTAKGVKESKKEKKK